MGGVDIYSTELIKNTDMRFSSTEAQYNPTLIDVWFDIDGTIYCVKSGETVKIKQSK